MDVNGIVQIANLMPERKWEREQRAEVHIWGAVWNEADSLRRAALHRRLPHVLRLKSLLALLCLWFSTRHLIVVPATSQNIRHHDHQMILVDC